MGTKRSPDEGSNEEMTDVNGRGSSPKRLKSFEAAGSPYLRPSRMPRSIGIKVVSSRPPPPPDQQKKLGESPALLKTQCQHDVSLPADFQGEYNISALKYPEKLAKEYTFDLDAFQRESIKCMDRNESVLVAAHTSAGKTVVAEYAIALALTAKQRVIYTSPIKALSNQKYREMAAEFEDVGLMTGDVTINKNASCLVMTTEILRSMLYRGSEIVREVAWVIFDEVHYMRDRERGVVWEETIILVPQNVRFVFLSATIPNAREFSEWIAHLKSQPCHTIYTNTRPVPLQHYIYPIGGTGIHNIVDTRGQFLTNNFEKAMSEIGKQNPDDKRGGFRKGKGGRQSAPGKSECLTVVGLLKERGWDPVIVFSFSRRDCEALAMQVAKLDFTSDDEKDLVKQVFQNAIDSLDVEDQNLPQITAILPLLQRGVGIHHSGLLPIVKEVVELLFQESLVKCLFATETFAMGVNMPARTVVFTAMRKFDGTEFRRLSGGEYIQMSGRAGRRGIDDKGVTIMMCDEQLKADATKTIMIGNAEPLKSTFKLGYNMLLNLLRAEEADPEYVIARSLAQFQADRALPANEQKLSRLEQERNAIKLGGKDIAIEDHEAKSYFRMRDVAGSLKQQVRDIVHEPTYIRPFLQSGRVVRVTMAPKQDDNDPDKDIDFGWGSIIKYTRKATGVKKSGEERYVVEVLLRCFVGSDKGQSRPRPYRPTTGGGRNQHSKHRNVDEEWMVVSCSLMDLNGASAMRVKLANNMRPMENRQMVGRSIVEILKRYPDGPPMLDPFGDLGIKDENLAVLLRKVEALEEAMIASPVAKSRHMFTLVQQWRERQALEKEIKGVKTDLQIARGLILKEELTKMKRVLRRLGFTNKDDIVEVKGRVACEVNAADELVITELLLGGNLNEMSHEVLVALCSCFVFDEGKTNENLKLDKDLQMAYDKLVTVATRVASVTKESNILINVDEYVESFSPNAMGAVLHWCRGETFTEVCSNSDLFEGSIIRCLRRLEELLRQLVAAVKSIGNTELEEKFTKGSTALRRGIAFHASLYV